MHSHRGGNVALLLCVLVKLNDLLWHVDDNFANVTSLLHESHGIFDSTSFKWGDWTNWFNRGLAHIEL